MIDHQEVLLRQEARFALWALRCGVAAVAGCGQARSDLEHGLELADVAGTCEELWALAAALHELGEGRIDWHHPRCSCVSLGEMAVLQALSAVAVPCGTRDPQPDRWWALVVDGVEIAQVDALARRWIQVLCRAGVNYPQPLDLVREIMLTPGGPVAMSDRPRLQ